MNEMELLKAKFKVAYEWLYDNDGKHSYEAGYVSLLEEYAAERFDLEMKTNEDFKNYVIKFVNFRNDCLSSDRECASFMLAIRM